MQRNDQSNLLLALAIKCINEKVDVRATCQKSIDRIENLDDDVAISEIKHFLHSYNDIRNDIINHYLSIKNKNLNVPVIYLVHTLFRTIGSNPKQIPGFDKYLNAINTAESLQVDALNPLGPLADSREEPKMVGLTQEMLEDLLPKNLNDFMLLIGKATDQTEGLRLIDTVLTAYESIKEDEEKAKQAAIKEKEQVLARIEEAKQAAINKSKEILTTNKTLVDIFEFTRDASNPLQAVTNNETDKAIQNMEFFKTMQQALNEIEAEYRRIYANSLIEKIDIQDIQMGFLINGQNLQTNKNHSRLTQLALTYNEIKDAIDKAKSTIHTMATYQNISVRKDNYNKLIESHQSLKDVKENFQEMKTLIQKFDADKTLLSSEDFQKLNALNVKSYDEALRRGDAQIFLDDSRFKNILKIDPTIDPKVKQTYDDTFRICQQSAIDSLNKNIIDNDNATTGLKKFAGRLVTLLWGVLGTALVFAGPAHLIYRYNHRAGNGWFLFGSKTQEKGHEVLENVKNSFKPV